MLRRSFIDLNLVVLIIYSILLAVETAHSGEDSWISTGLTDRVCYSMIIHPADRNVLYVGTRVGHVFKSSDRGITWASFSRGLPNFPITSLIGDPIDPNTVYVGTLGDGVFKTNNGGGLWSSTNSNLAPTILSLAIAHQNPSVIYAGSGDGGGLYKSSDGGGNWVKKSDGLLDYYVKAIAIDPTNSNNVYIGTSFGIYRSTDGGENFTSATQGLTTAQERTLYSLTVDRNNPNVIYAGTGAGLYRSLNRGLNWLRVPNLPEEVVNFTVIDASTSSMLYVGNTYSGTFRSSNGGASWTEFNTNLDNLRVFSAAIDPIYASEVYVGTFGDGVFTTADVFPPNFSVAIVQNPILSNFLDIYAIPTEILSAPPTFLANGDTISRVQQISSSEAEIYVADHSLQSSGNISLTIIGTDLSGNEGRIIRTFSASFIYAARGGILTSHDGQLRLSIDAGAVSRDVYLLSLEQDMFGTGRIGPQLLPQSAVQLELESNSHDLPGYRQVELDILPAYSIMPHNVRLMRRAELTFDLEGSYFDDRKIEDLSIYKYENDTWMRIDSNVDLKANRISGYISELGIYQLRPNDFLEPRTLPTAFQLDQNYPNPFNLGTTIRYVIPESGGENDKNSNSVLVNISIFDVRGKLVRTLLNEEHIPGFYSIHWDGRDEHSGELASGVYFYVLKASSYIARKKMIVVK